MGIILLCSWLWNNLPVYIWKGASKSNLKNTLSLCLGSKNSRKIVLIVKHFNILDNEKCFRNWMYYYCCCCYYFYWNHISSYKAFCYNSSDCSGVTTPWYPDILYACHYIACIVLTLVAWGRMGSQVMSLSVPQLCEWLILFQTSSGLNCGNFVYRLPHLPRSAILFLLHSFEMTAILSFSTRFMMYLDQWLFNGKVALKWGKCEVIAGPWGTSNL